MQLGELILIDGNEPDEALFQLKKYKSVNSNQNDKHYFWSSLSLAKAYKAVGDVEQYLATIALIKSEDYKRDSAFTDVFKKEIVKD